MAEEQRPLCIVTAVKSCKDSTIKEKLRENYNGDILNFKKKQSIAVFAYDKNTDSLYGSLDGKKGWFPTSLVKFKDDLDLNKEVVPKEMFQRRGSKSANSKDISYYIENNKFQKGVVYNNPLKSIKYINSYGIPLVLESAVEFIMKEDNIKLLGLFRVEGKLEEVNAVRELIERGEKVDFSTITDKHTPSTLIKFFLRDLPEPLLTHDLFYSFSEASKIDSERIYEQFQMLLSFLPVQNYNVVQFISKFLIHCISHSADNNFNINTAAKMFGQVYCRKKNFSIDIEEIQNSNSVAKYIIENSSTLFSEFIDINDKKLEKARDSKRKKERELMYNYTKSAQKNEKKERKKLEKQVDPSIIPFLSPNEVRKKRLSYNGDIPTADSMPELRIESFHLDLSLNEIIKDERQTSPRKKEEKISPRKREEKPPSPRGELSIQNHPEIDRSSPSVPSSPVNSPPSSPYNDSFYKKGFYSLLILIVISHAVRSLL